MPGVTGLGPTGGRGNPSTPVGLLEVVLRQSRDDKLVAADVETADAVLEGLVGSNVVGVRVALVKRPYLPALPVLAGDADVRVRVAVARQRATPVGVLRVLAGDAEVKVRVAVHRNRSAPDEVRVIAALLGVG